MNINPMDTNAYTEISSNTTQGIKSKLVIHCHSFVIDKGPFTSSFSVNVSSTLQ